MRREATATASTIDEAIELARAELGIGDEIDVEIEIIDQPEKKVLGIFGGKPAKVTLSYDDGKKEEKPKKEKKEAPKAAKKPVKKEAAPVKKAKAEEKPAKMVAINQTSLDNTLNFVKDVLSHMDIGEFTCSVSDVEGGFCITVEGEGMGAVIGRRGETLDAIQYLAGLAANGAGGYYKVSLNIGDYRERREQTLTALAVKVSEQVLRTGKNRTLEPMNPYERRIIHTAVQNIEGVVSNSFGEGSGRRVVISIEGSDPRPQRREGGKGRNQRGRDRKPSNKVEAPVREPKKDSDTPLYGKIN